ncbi:MAG: pyridine nucleotide-disulfide oxidoreductase [Lentisphaerales bacterium]|nr:MAG: pyridine nucleotide-disulfide oxidoreductase [Lentisphaerales bacterium]
MKKVDVVVVGGSAAGIPVALTVRRQYSEKTVLVVRKEQQVLIPCGIPYIFGTVGSPDKNLIPDMILKKNEIGLLVSEVQSIDLQARVLKTEAEDLQYERLVLATGSTPVRPPIPGVDLDGVFAIEKNVSSLSRIQEKVMIAESVVVIGGGFIGIEFADEIKKSGVKSVTIVECVAHCLSLAYDTAFCVEMEKHLKARGVEIMTGSTVERIDGESSVESVVLSGGTIIPTSVVILGIGASANATLAKAAGLELAPDGSVAVDRNMKTSDPNVFACGDCASKVSFFGGKPSSLKLASIATYEARIAGANVFALKRENIGTVGVWSTAVGDLAMGTAGLTESVARREGYEVVATTVESPNRHPGCMPGAQACRLKLLFERSSGVLLGGQIMGDVAIGEIINTLSACIQKKMNAEDLAMFQTGTHPALTASPIAYPLVNAAELAIMQMK